MTKSQWLSLECEFVFTREESTALSRLYPLRRFPPDDLRLIISYMVRYGRLDSLHWMIDELSIPMWLHPTNPNYPKCGPSLGILVTQGENKNHLSTFSSHPPTARNTPVGCHATLRMPKPGFGKGLNEVKRSPDKVNTCNLNWE